jgi:hypothetical protein
MRHVSTCVELRLQGWACQGAPVLSSDIFTAWFTVYLLPSEHETESLGERREQSTCVARTRTPAGHLLGWTHPPHSNKQHTLLKYTATHLAVYGVKLLGPVTEGDDLGGTHKRKVLELDVVEARVECNRPHDG